MRIESDFMTLKVFVAHRKVLNSFIILHLGGCGVEPSNCEDIDGDL